MGIWVQDEPTEVRKLLPSFGQLEICCRISEYQDVQHPTLSLWQLWVICSWVHWQMPKQVLSMGHPQVDDTSRMTIQSFVLASVIFPQLPGEELQWIRSQRNVLPPKCYIWLCHFSSLGGVCSLQRTNTHMLKQTAFSIHYCPWNHFIMEQQWP